MALKLSVLWRGTIGKIILVGFAIAIAIHLVILAIFTHTTNDTRFRLNYTFVTRQVTTVLATLQQIDPAQIDNTVKKIALPNILLSLSDQPRKGFTFNLETPLWQVLRRLNQETPHRPLKLSVYLPNGQWLNISAVVVRSPLLPELMLLFVEFIILIAVLISILAINRFTRPLKKLRHAAEQLGLDLDTKPLAVYGPAVVQDTAHAINKMQIRIRELLRHRMQLLAGLSHDLRTPITRLKLRVHLIEDQTLQQKMNRDLDEIEAMVNDTLAYVRKETHDEPQAKFDLASLLHAICEDFCDTGADVHCHFSCEQATINGRIIALRRVFTNIIDNAVKYAGSTDVSLSCHKKYYRIMITDQGSGIDDRMKEKVFDPFYRGEHSRSRHTGGSGLGLAIVRDIIQQHHGSIILSDAQPHGLQVTITLPTR